MKKKMINYVYSKIYYKVDEAECHKHPDGDPLYYELYEPLMIDFYNIFLLIRGDIQRKIIRGDI